VSPPWACEIHHLHHWADGGPTNLDNLALICWHHHQLIHARDLGAAETRANLRPVTSLARRSRADAPHPKSDATPERAATPAFSDCEYQPV
jgi:5-methylcytosine-specific restriction endonuclease McrA